ncbi:MAG: PstS family phosphate ABC transporter substrate-binding protein [Pseudomonadota bacterium]
MATALAAVAATSGAWAQAREQIRMVGSSTVFPFATAVAEEFSKTTRFKAPIVESTGTGGGFKLFCGGVGYTHPDISNASRAIKDSEVKLCAKNGVTAITEIKIGYDGIVLANSKAAPTYRLSLRDIYLALARNVPAPGGDGAKLVPNPYITWRQIDPRLPNIKIEVLGPPPTSGTRDAFTELAMEGGCGTFPALKALEKTDKNAHQAACATLREDGAFIEAGENDNLIVQKLAANPEAIGIFGYSFLEQNQDKLQGSVVDGVAPTFDNIAAGAYPVSRSLFVYVKNQHVGSVPGLKEFIAEFTADKAWGDYGYLADKGLIPMPQAERVKYRNDALALRPLQTGS